MHGMRWKLQLFFVSVCCLYVYCSHAIKSLHIKEILGSFLFFIYLASMGVRSAATHLQPNLYHYLDWKDLSSPLSYCTNHMIYLLMYIKSQGFAEEEES